MSVIGKQVYLNESSLQSEDGLNLIDTHCHLDAEPLFSNLPELLEGSRKAGVHSFVIPGVCPEGWRGIVALADINEGVFAACGIHPVHAEKADNKNLSALEHYASRGIAIGETGIDPFSALPFDIQERAFMAQIRMAINLRLPLLVHCRKAFRRTLEILRQEHAEQVGGIMHAFSGSPEMALEFIQLGFVISLSGSVTWNNALKPVRLARELPLDCIVLETDAPDMSPQRCRHSWNRPAWMLETLTRVAEIRGMSCTELARICTANTLRVLPGILG